jgi:hypothetical protein
VTSHNRFLIPPSLKISESISNGSYCNTDGVWWRYGISRSCDEWIKRVGRLTPTDNHTAISGPIFFTNSSIVAILELIRGAQCLIEVIRSSGEEMWRVDAYQIPYYSRGIEIFESEIILIPPSWKISESSSNGSYRNTDEVWWRYGISRSCDEWTLLETANSVKHCFKVADR